MSSDAVEKAVDGILSEQEGPFSRIESISAVVVSRDEGAFLAVARIDEDTGGWRFSEYSYPGYNGGGDLNIDVLRKSIEFMKQEIEDAQKILELHKLYWKSGVRKRKKENRRE